MEKKKPTIDEIYKLNVDGLFESTANWFDNAFKKSQAEINRDLYNKINGYSSSSESTGGNVSLGPLLTSLNGSNLYPSRGYLYYNGNGWEFNTPTISGGEGGGVVDTAAITKIVNDTIKNVSWWGQNINNNKVDGNIVITKGSHSFTIELDDNGNLKFNGNIYTTGGITAFGSSGSISGGGTGGSGVTLNPTMSAMNDQLGETTSNTPQFLYWDGSTYTWKNESEISGGSGSSSRIKNIKLFTNNSDYSFETIELGTADTIGFMQGDNITFQAVVKEFTNVIKISATGGSGGTGSSSGTTAGKLYFYKNGSEEYWNGESNFKIIFGSGLNVTWDSHSQITLSATGSGSGGSTSTSVSWEDVTNKPSTFTPSSHTHSTNEINGLSNYVQGVKVNNATNADKATQLANSRTIWGQSFNGTSDINADLRMGTAGGGSIKLWMNNGNMLDRTGNTLHIGFGLKESSDGEIRLDANVTKIYTSNITNSKHYDFKSNVFDVNSNQIHFGSETNGGKIYWDAANNAFKIEGNVYATGGITALGVSNNATTSNNVDFTFRSVTANAFNVMDSIQLSDSLKLNRSGNDAYLSSQDGIRHSIYLDEGFTYEIDSSGDAYFNSLDCDILNFSGCTNFEIFEANDLTFTIKFNYGGKTYKFTPSTNVDIS